MKRNRLKVLRAECQITQMDLARKTGLALNRYWRIENGYDDPTNAELRKLAKALHADESALGFDLPTEATQ